MKDNKIGAAVSLGSPKINFANGERGFDKVSAAPDIAINSASIIKGKSEGITTSPHTEMPLLIPFETLVPNTKSSIPIIITQTAVTTRFIIKITHKIYAPAYFYSRFLITFGIKI